MNWLNQLLFRPPEEPPSAPGLERPAAPAVPTPAEIAQLRAALVGAPDGAALGAAELALGRGLALAGQSALAADSPVVWAAAICEVADKSLALDWLARCDDLTLLAGVAQHARHAEVRLAAAQRIDDGPTLVLLARAAKGKDKAVYRHCADLLRGRRQERARQEHGARLAEALQALLATAPLSVSRLLELERELKEEIEAAQAAADAAPVAAAQRDPPVAAGSAAGADALAHCQALCEQASLRVRREAEQSRHLQTAQAAWHALAAELEGAAWAGEAQHRIWLERWQALREAGADLPDWPAAMAAVTQLRQGLDELGGRLDEMARDGQRCAACEAFLASVATAPGAGDAPVVQAWGALELPHDAALRRAFEERWAALQPAAAPPAEPTAAAAPTAAVKPRAAKPPPVDGDALRGLVQELEDAVDQGQLGEADAAAKRIKALLGDGSAERRLDARLQRALGKMGELRDWAKWGANKQREQLIEAALALLSGEPTVDHVAVAVPALREAWKHLNSQGPASKSQWETFDGALEKAYVPVAAQRAEEAQRRAQARARKEELLAQGEAWLASIDWSGADHGAVEARLAEWLAQWRGAPMAGFRDERQLRKRVDALRGTIEQQLQQGRSVLIERRRELIAAAQALAAGADLRHAVGEVKALQERWRAPPGSPRLNRGDEQKLWHAFRGACDAVFARREAQRKEESQQRDQQAQARVRLLEGFAAALDGTDAREIRRALTQFLADWRASPAPPSAARGPAGAGAIDVHERQARALQQRARQRLEELDRAAYRQRLEQPKAAPPPAPDGAGQPDAAVLERGRQERERLLLDLEIALDLPSPAEHADARRRRQIEQLQSRFRTGARQSSDAEALLGQWQGTAAAADPAQDRRVAVVIDALVGRHARAAQDVPRAPAGAGQGAANPGRRNQR